MSLCLAVKLKGIYLSLTAYDSFPLDMHDINVYCADVSFLFIYGDCDRGIASAGFEGITDPQRIVLFIVVMSQKLCFAVFDPLACNLATYGLTPFYSIEYFNK